MRDAVKAKILSEQEGDVSMDMVMNRNKTFHIYHQEMAEEIAKNISQFYQFMHAVVQRLYGKIESI